MAALRSVQPGETEAKKRTAMSITKAAADGDQMDLLVSMRARIAKTVEDSTCPPRDLASLTRRLQDISREIESIQVRAKQEAREDAATADEDWDAEAL